MATQVTFVSRIPAATAQAHTAILEATQETFELDIKPMAVERSPVTPEGFARNVALGRPHPGGTGHNRRSIDVTVEMTDRGPRAQLFTQSGYGGYLEVGTSRMRAQPYLYPSFIENVDKIPQRTRVKIGELGQIKKQP